MKPDSSCISLMINGFTLRGFHYSIESALHYGKREMSKLLPGFEEKMKHNICLDQPVFLSNL